MRVPQPSKAALLEDTSHCVRCIMAARKGDQEHVDGNTLDSERSVQAVTADRARAFQTADEGQSETGKCFLAAAKSVAQLTDISLCRLGGQSQGCSPVKVLCLEVVECIVAEQ